MYYSKITASTKFNLSLIHEIYLKKKKNLDVTQLEAIRILKTYQMWHQIL